MACTPHVRCPHSLGPSCLGGTARPLCRRNADRHAALSGSVKGIRQPLCWHDNTPHFGWRTGVIFLAILHGARALQRYQNTGSFMTASRSLTLHGACLPATSLSTRPIAVSMRSIGHMKRLSRTSHKMRNTGFSAAIQPASIGSNRDKPHKRPSQNL